MKNSSLQQGMWSKRLQDSAAGQEPQITKRRHVIARLVPENAQRAREIPDFLGRLRTIYGDQVLPVSGAELVAEDGSRY
jgi:antitoxin (DNA-binding transcriptional repressor) of toxin-antitoxin stability system